MSIVALSEKECELWVKGLRHLVQDTIYAPYPLQVERWLRKEFYAMENSHEMYVSIQISIYLCKDNFDNVIFISRVTLKDVKAFLPRVNYKISTNKLREVFQEVDTKNRTEIGFDDFVILYHKLMFDLNVSKNTFITCEYFNWLMFNFI